MVAKAWPSEVLAAIKCGPVPRRRDWRKISDGGKLTRGEKVCAFIERFCLVPEGAMVGKPMRLLPFQEAFILATYDAPGGVARSYLSIARKNGKTALNAAILLAHIVGPEKRLNTQIISGARSRDQAALVFKLAEKMVRLSPTLSKLCRIVPSTKTIVGLVANVEFKAISAEAGTAHGLSPAVALLDEVGQIRGEADAFVEAIETAQGAHENPLLIVISTQASKDADLFSVWIDKAESDKPARVVSHVYTAPEDAALDDEAAWKMANPALGVFRSVQDMRDFSAQAASLPSKEQSFRWLFLNQRLEAENAFVSRAVWAACGGEPDDLRGHPVYCGLDLSSAQDLTAFVMMGRIGGVWHVRPTFWLPGDGLREKAWADRVPYDVWAREGHLQTSPGKTVDYEHVAQWIASLFDHYDIRSIAFDRWNFRHLRPWLERAGMSEAQIGRFVEFGQGFASMSPALRDLETELVNQRLRHGSHPVLTMCASNAKVEANSVGDRKLNKRKSTGRIDGMVALAMAFGVAPLETEAGKRTLDDFLLDMAGG